MSCWVYIQTERWTDDDGTPHSLWTVGFYDPTGRFQTDSDHSRREDAARRCNFLNGGKEPLYEDPLSQALNEGDGVYRP